MEKVYFSKQWDNAPMPNFMFFTQRGHATLFDLVKKAGYNNSVVVIKGGLFNSGSGNTVADTGKGPRKSFLEWLNGRSAKSVKVTHEVTASPLVAKKKKLSKSHVVVGTTEG